MRLCPYLRGGRPRGLVPGHEGPHEGRGGWRRHGGRRDGPEAVVGGRRPDRGHGLRGLLGAQRQRGRRGCCLWLRRAVSMTAGRDGEGATRPPGRARARASGRAHPHHHRSLYTVQSSHDTRTRTHHASTLLLPYFLFPACRVGAHVAGLDWHRGAKPFGQAPGKPQAPATHMTAR